MPHQIPPALIQIFEDPYDMILSTGILGTADLAVIHRALATFCEAWMGSALAARARIKQRIPVHMETGFVAQMEAELNKQRPVIVHGKFTSAGT